TFGLQARKEPRSSARKSLASGAVIRQQVRSVTSIPYESQADPSRELYHTPAFSWSLHLQHINGVGQVPGSLDLPLAEVHGGQEPLAARQVRAGEQEDLGRRDPAEVVEESGEGDQAFLT